MIVAIHNPKGGVGKTTTAVNLAAVLAQRRRSVLLVDLEADMNASISVGIGPQHRVPSILGALLNPRRPPDVVRRLPHLPNLHVIPGGVNLADAPYTLRHAKHAERRLHDVLRPLTSTYDIVIVDPPADYGLLAHSAMLAADHLLVPVRAEYLCLESLAHFLRWYRDRRSTRRVSAHLTGILLTRVDYRRQATREIVDIIRTHNRHGVLRTEVPEDPRAIEAPSHGIPLALYAPVSRASRAYGQLATELLQRISRQQR